MKNRKLFNNNELEILRYISRGYSTRDIGEKLNFAKGTIESYVKNMLLKTNTVNRAHLIYECSKSGVLK